MEETSPRLLSFDPIREPTVPRDAATVVVLREGSLGLEVFCVVRHQASFLGGVVVFPGGKVDAADGAPIWADVATEPPPRTADLASEGATPRALAVAACRELLEEACFAPLDPPVGGDEVDALRAEAVRGEGGFAGALVRRRKRLAIDRLVPWGRWITPESEARRFDARFFLLEAPPDQAGRHDDHEITMSFWARPIAVLDRFVRGDIMLAPPTTRTLELLAAASDVRAALELAERQSLKAVCPTFVPAGPTAGEAIAPFLALPGDPAHAVRETRVGGPSRFVLREGRFFSAEPLDDEGDRGGRGT